MKDAEKTKVPSSEVALAKLPTYRKLWRNTVINTSLVALAPLIVLGVVNYQIDQTQLNQRNELEVRNIVTNTRQHVESVIQDRRAALALVAGEQSFDDLTNQDNLDAALRNLNASFSGFVDLAVIAPSGRQSSYSGPYDRSQRDDCSEKWFHEVLLRGTYVGDVFAGDLDFPHFVIAHKHQPDRGGFYVLCATLDAALLQRETQAERPDSNTDVFITNRRGALQTASAFFGPVLATARIDIPDHCCNKEIIETRREAGRRSMEGFAAIEETPFILIAVKTLPRPLSQWLARRSDWLWFVFISAAVILGVVLYGATNTVKRLQRADRRRVKILHNIEYTSKLATIGRMAAGIAHEINNPLAIINENAGLLRDLAERAEDYPQKEKTLTVVDSILNSVKRCSGVTRRLLGFARRMDVSHETIDLEHLVKEVVGFQRTEAAHRNIEVIYSFPPSMPSIESDRGQLQQVFLNIISNAFAAVDEGGKIDVIGAPGRDGEVALMIEDNGKGISKEDLKHVFEPFFSTKGEFGTGLGLSITRDIIQRLGGRIEAESAEGKGTSFRVTLPVRASDRIETGDE